MGLGLQSSDILMQSYQRTAEEAFTRAAELSTAVRVLFWFKETGDNVRNGLKYTQAQLHQRKMILDAAHAVIKMERDEELQRFMNHMDLRDGVAALQETLDGGFE